MKIDKPRVLFLDVETAPLSAWVWGLFDQNVGLSQINKEWHLLSFCAKWLDDPESKVVYMDQSKTKNIEDDSKLLKAVWKLMDTCDILVTQNGVSFDVKKLNARFVLNGMTPPSSYKNIDTLRIAKQKFGFTSNKLEWMTKKLCKKYTKLAHSEFSGFELWKQCLAGNKKAWKVMREYNIADVLSLEELYHKLLPWANNAPNFSIYNNEYHHVCRCGSTNSVRNGYAYTTTGKFIRYLCKDCGAESRDAKNLLTKEKRDSLKRKV